jgi:hypothetical protein
MGYNKNLQIKELERWLNFREGPNNQNPFSLWMGYGTSYLPWCGAFANYCAVEAGGFDWNRPGVHAQFGRKGDGYVPGSIQSFKEMGIYRSRFSFAKPGWQVCYDWSGSGGDHIETVIMDYGNGWTLNIGGNTNDMVAYRKRPKDANLVAFGALDEAGQNESGIIVPKPPTNDGAIGGRLDMKKTDKVDGAVIGAGSVVLQADGGVIGSPFYGSVPGLKIELVMGKNHAVSILPTESGKGYWIMGHDGGIFTFGDASYRGNFRSYVSLATSAVELVRGTNGGYRAILSNTKNVSPVK